ncbi:DNA helicase/exodeoxyribonuclease V gamma subunit [Chitinophaga skermanii]|uniref:RecBCD enzyme subunit RecC n=1 Tax=Chitinophaga skermanii TaxID=331697 RepID=A0A327Q2B5_9BACT|nr:exodeoxyribonuclease V subunit gamma [Chitinophaga skermanii]RAI97851.1 DNA helicase/exodeoxyribonuclease V gamma subunit [Chitinophaga skermanii]
MALFLKVSNSLESLAEGLINDLQTANYSVFQPHYIITQTEGMNNWLKHRQAYQVGIAANARFLKPNDLLFQLYMILGGPSIQSMSSQHLSWLLFKLLGEPEFIERYPDVAAYYLDHGEETDLKKMVLAEKVADLLDQYQVYRPGMIQQWNQADMQTLQTEEWQEWLWVRVKQLSGDILPDKTLIGNYILDILKSQPEKHKSLVNRMPAIHLFGLSILTVFHVEILHEVSKVIDVHFHILNPAPGVFWFEDRNEKQLARWRAKGLQDRVDAAVVGNALLTGWGKVIQNSFALFFANDGFLNAYEEIGVVEPRTDSLLHKIQHDIFTAATDHRTRFSENDLTDGSITVHACYTVAREVEALYNYLVHLSDQRREKLSSRDIVVMVSDIDAYAPYIKAVFNHAPHRFRYTIADESYADNDNLFNALQAVLLLDEETFAAEAVMQLLDFSYIRKRFNLKDPVYLRPAVEAANIRFGIEGNKEDETQYVSWKYGIQRIMYGICMSGEPEFGEYTDSFFPLDIAEGQEAYDLIRFCHFAQVLITAVEERREARSIADWVKYVEQLLHSLVYEQQDESDEDYTTLLKELSAFNLLHEYLPGKVPYSVFVHSLLNVITGTTRSSLFANGGITFCSLIPMRSIPFKVVALLGLNHDKFPRKENKSSFDIMSKEPKRGDRNLKENDKHLFLETTISAQQYLYISYLGRSVSDNTAIPPSVLVDELLDYIEAGYNGNPEDVRKKLVKVQPMQEFSRKYGQVPGLYSYLDVNALSSLHFINPNKTIEAPQLEEFTLDMLTNFFKNPFKAYYNKVLGIYFNDDPILLGETELFSLDKLQQWGMKHKLLPTQGITPAERAALVKTGKLPLRNMAYVAVQHVEEKVQPVRALFEACTAGKLAERLDFDIQVDEVVLKCSLENVYDGTWVKVSWSTRDLRNMIEAYIAYLAGVAAGKLTGLQFISGAAKEQVFEATSISREDAIQRLRILKNFYLQGLTEILPFSPDFDIEPAKIAGIDEEKFAKLVHDIFEGGKFANSDRYMVKEYERGYFDQPSHAITFKRVCEQVVAPLADIFPGYYSK